MMVKPRRTLLGMPLELLPWTSRTLNRTSSACDSWAGVPSGRFGVVSASPLDESML